MIHALNNFFFLWDGLMLIRKKGFRTAGSAYLVIVFDLGQFFIGFDYLLLQVSFLFGSFFPDSRISQGKDISSQDGGIQRAVNSDCGHRYPGGICRMASMESSPSRGALIGTPITGRVVIEAITPGRWAAMPAAAMITLIPRPLAAFNFPTFSGVL